MNIVLTGVTGQLGGELLPLLAYRGRVTCIGRNLPSTTTGNNVETDLADVSALQSVLNSIQPDLIINAAAYTAVDLAETEVDLAYLINEQLPEQLATWSHRHGAGLMHYSTDYVFDGQADKPYVETDATNPQSVYGKSKLAGELAIVDSGCDYAILRTSWVYSAHGKNFVLSMLELAKKFSELKIVCDQVGSPTFARNLALVSSRILENWCSSDARRTCGIYHYRDSGIMSWYDFANRVFSASVASGILKNAPSVTAIPGSEYQQAASRPDYSVLSCQKIESDFGIKLFSFDSALQLVLNEYRSALS